MVITKKGSGGAPDEELVDTVLQKNAYNLNPLLPEIEDSDRLDVSVKAYKKPTPGATVFDTTATATDADGRILAGLIDASLSGSQLSQSPELTFPEKARGTIKLALNFKPFIDYLQAQGDTNGTQQFIFIEAYAHIQETWIRQFLLDMPGKGGVGPDEGEAHTALNAQNNYIVPVTMTQTIDANRGAYRIIIDNGDYSHNARTVMENPFYAGEIVDKTAAPIPMDVFDEK